MVLTGAWGGGGGGFVWAVKMQTCRGYGGKIVETLDCLGLHFAQFRGGEREKETCRVVKRKSQSPALEYNTGLKIKAG